MVNPSPRSEVSIADAESQLCTFFKAGECRYADNCACIHGDICDVCGKAVLHPRHESQRKQHKQVGIVQTLKASVIGYLAGVITENGG